MARNYETHVLQIERFMNSWCVPQVRDYEADSEVPNDIRGTTEADEAMHCEEWTLQVGYLLRPHVHASAEDRPYGDTAHAVDAVTATE